MTKKALITGITGQDGSYLAELLLGKGYEVHGLIRRASSFNTGRIDHVYEDSREPGARLFLHHGDMTDGIRLLTLLTAIRPDEVYNLAGQSQVRESFDQPRLTADVVAMGAVHLLEAIRHSGLDCRLYQAGSSDMFGDADGAHDERSPLAPRSPNAAAKAFAYWTARNYRDGYGLFAVNGIAFNHESPRRGETFVTRKITQAVARIRAGRQDYLYLGDLSPVRDWGYAPEYVDAMWRSLQRDEPDDYVLATGRGHSVQEFLEAAFAHADLDLGRHIRFDERYLRPTDIRELLGDAGKAADVLGWRASVTMQELAGVMVDADVDALDHEGEHWIDRVRLDAWPHPPA